MLANQPTYIERGRFRCVIMDAPTDVTAQAYIKILQGYGVTDVVRTCESTYDIGTFAQSGITVHDNTFPDGDPPPASVIENFLAVYDKVVSNQTAFAVQCVAGLGRAPVLASIALLEREGMEPMEVIRFIRQKRKGAINARQVRFIEDYKCQHGKKQCNCSLM